MTNTNINTTPIAQIDDAIRVVHVDGVKAPFVLTAVCPIAHGINLSAACTALSLYDMAMEATQTNWDSRLFRRRLVLSMLDATLALTKAREAMKKLDEATQEVTLLISEAFGEIVSPYYAGVIESLVRLDTPKARAAKTYLRLMGKELSPAIAALHAANKNVRDYRPPANFGGERDWNVIKDLNDECPAEDGWMHVDEVLFQFALDLNRQIDWEVMGECYDLTFWETVLSVC